jgi:hypothetical protein
MTGTIELPPTFEAAMDEWLRSWDEFILTYKGEQEKEEEYDEEDV